MRVVLLGSYSPAVRVLHALQSTRALVVGVGAHQGEPDDARWESLCRAADRCGLPTVQFTAGKRNEIFEFVRRCQPDLGVTIGFRYLLDRATIQVPQHGWVNFHSGLLPKYRGRAPVNWAIINGEDELGVTLHFIDEGMDTGDIIFQKRFALAETEDVGDALAKLFPLYGELARDAVEALLRGEALPRMPQDHSKATVFPRRTPEEGEIDWSWDANRVLNLIRALAQPYPGAFSRVDSQDFIVWKAVARKMTTTGANPGFILSDGSICCGRDCIIPLAATQKENCKEAINLSRFAGFVCGNGRSAVLAGCHV